MADNEETKNSTATETSASNTPSTDAPAAKAEGRGRRPNPRREAKPQQRDGLSGELEERVVAVNRVAKVVKGGRRFSFSALVIVGDKKGKVGYGLGKAKEVPDAIRKASQLAAKTMIPVSIQRGTIPHTIMGEFDAGKILFKPASEGTGIKAAGACRTILELAGVKDALTKSLRGSNPHNVVKATFDALKHLRSESDVAAIRGRDPKDLRMKSIRK